MEYNFNFGVVLTNKAFLLGGILITIHVMAVSFVIAFAIGLLLGALLLSKWRSLNIPTRIYIEMFRNTPALIQLVWIYYCLPIFTGVSIDPITCSIIALALNASAYMAEDFRAGIQAVHKGEIEAARSLGMSYRETMQKVVIPQALRILIPPLMNHAVGLMKWSALVSVVGVADLTYKAQMLSSRLFRPIEIFTSIGLVYFAMSMTLSYAVKFLERRWAKY